MAGPVQHVVFNMTVNGKKATEWPMDFTLRESWGLHDIYSLRIVVPKGRTAGQLQAWPDGSAVTVQWGRNPGGGVETWYGYVNHHELTTADDLTMSQNVQITYILIGTSKVINGDKNRTWKNMTPDVICQIIAKEQSMRCVVTRSDWKLSYEVQAHESDFEFLNRIADKVGYRFWMSGGTMYFIDPIVLLAGQTTNSVPTYSINKTPFIQDNAYNFRVLQGDSIPGGSQMKRQIWGVDSNTGQVFHTEADVATQYGQDKINNPYIPNLGYDVTQDYIVDTSRHTTSRGEAKRLQNATQGLSQFWIVATVEVYGNVHLYPGKAINLNGTNLPNLNTAGWIVTAVEHVGRLGGISDPTADSLVSRLTIVTNQKTSVPHIKGIHIITPEKISCNLVGGKWKASTANVIIEGVVSA